MKQELQEYKEIFDEYKNPKITKVNSDFKVSKIGILFLMVFYTWQYFFMPKSITNYFLKTLNLSIYTYFFILDTITLILTIIIFKNELKTAFKNYKNQIQNYLKYLLYTLLIFSILNLLISLICNVIIGEIPDNQKSLQSLNLIYLSFSSLIYAPIVEELLFRASIRKIIKNKKLFIIISGLIFGLIHVIGASSLSQYLFIIEYGFCGCFLAFLYTKYNNIYLNISAHFILNLMGVLNIIINLIQ